MFDIEKVNGLVEQDAGGVKIVVKGSADKVDVCTDAEVKDVESPLLFVVYLVTTTVVSTTVAVNVGVSRSTVVDDGRRVARSAVVDDGRGPPTISNIVDVDPLTLSEVTWVATLTARSYANNLILCSELILKVGQYWRKDTQEGYALLYTKQNIERVG